MWIRIPNRTSLEVLSGDRAKDKEGFFPWRDRLEMHLDTVWTGLGEVFDKNRDAKTPLTSEESDALAAKHGDKPHDTEDEDWEMKSVGGTSTRC